MVNLFEIMRSAQSGQALNNMSRQFGLGPPDMQRAMEALLPAFSLAFQRAVQDPRIFAQFLEMLASGRYAPFYDGLARAGSSDAQPDMASGMEALNRLMGSKDVTRRVAEQAAVATGIGAEILQQMLPLMAATLMGGMFRYVSLQGLGDLFARWADAFHHAHAAQQAAAEPASAKTQPGNPFELWTSLLGPMSAGTSAASGSAGASQAGAGQARSGPTAPANPIEAWAAMMDAMLGREPPKPPPPEPPKPANPVQVLSEMFEAGTTMQAQYVATLRSIMERFWTAGQTQAEGSRP